MKDPIADFVKENIEKVAALEKALLEKATADKAFRQELLADPMGVVRRQLSSMVPEVAADPALLDAYLRVSLEFKVVERTASQFYLVLPPLDTGTEELALDDLDMVAGGHSSGPVCSDKSPSIPSGPCSR